MNFVYIIYNIIFGLAVGLVISSFYIKNYIYHGPNSLDVQNNIFIADNRCYKLIPNIVKCPFYNSHN